MKTLAANAAKVKVFLTIAVACLNLNCRCSVNRTRREKPNEKPSVSVVWPSVGVRLFLPARFLNVTHYRRTDLLRLLTPLQQ